MLEAMWALEIPQAATGAQMRNRGITGRSGNLAVGRPSVLQGIGVIDQTCGGVSSNRSVPDVQKKTTGAKWFEQGALCAVAKRVGDGWGRRVSNVPENVMQLSMF